MENAAARILSAGIEPAGGPQPAFMIVMEKLPCI